METIESRLVLGPDDHGRLTTHEEFADAAYVDGWRYERVDERLVVMSPEVFDHQRTSEPWRDFLVEYKLSHRDRVEYVFSSPWARIGKKHDRIGDIGVYLVRDRPGSETPERPPDLMFEIVSPGRVARERNYEKKRVEYFQAGIREYVIIDRFTRRVTVLTEAAGGYREQVLGEADTYTSPLLPGLAIPLSEVI